MRAVMTLLLDSYRMLCSQVIFWVSMVITTFIALVYLSIGYDENGMTVLFGLMSFESELFRDSRLAEVLYLGIFSKFIVAIWLSWGAIILALISCASIFPSTMEEGTAAIVMTKAPRRMTVFLVRFLGSLFFVLIQVSLFTAIVFVALKWRTGSWNPSVFWYIPLVLLVFFYLYSFLTLVAVTTRSALVAILLTIGLWLTSFAVNFARVNLSNLTTIEGGVLMGEEKDNLKKWYELTESAYALLPKTSPTLEVADSLIVVSDEKGFSNAEFATILMNQEVKEIDRGDSALYIIGSSLAFSFVMLGLASWRFCRRDY